MRLQPTYFYFHETCYKFEEVCVKYNMYLKRRDLQNDGGIWNKPQFQHIL